VRRRAQRHLRDPRLPRESAIKHAAPPREQRHDVVEVEALSAHLVSCAEVVTCVRDELIVGWVVDGFDADDLCNERVMVLVHMFDEFELRGGRTDHEDFFHSLQRAGNVVIEPFCVGRVASLGSHPGVSMNVMMRGFERGGFEVLRAQVENLGLMMVHPNGSMSRLHDRTVEQVACRLEIRLACPSSPSFVREEDRAWARFLGEHRHKPSPWRLSLERSFVKPLPCLS
jgi:hypothetical protein